MATSTDLIQQLYVAYYNRPADVAGLTYWVAQLDAGQSIDAISKSFNSAKEYTDAYAGKTADEIVDTVYLNLFGRHAEAGGLDYWGGLLQAKTVTVADIVKAVIAGTVDAEGNTNSDGAAFNNKVTAAEAFTTELSTAGNEAERVAYAGGTAAVLAAAKGYIAGVTDDASLAAATAGVHDAAQNLVTITTPTTVAALTASVDTIVGLSGNDVFNATGVTLSALDSINGGAGKNTLNIADTTGASAAGLPAGAVLKNIQAININSSSRVGTNFSAGSAGTPAVKEVDTIAFATTAATDTYDVTYNGVTVTTAATAGATAAEAAGLVAGAINAIAGATIAVVVGDQVVVTAPVAGIALPSYNVSGNGTGVASATLITPSAVAVAAQAATTDAVYDVSGVTGLTTVVASSIGGENLNAAATTDVTVTDTGTGGTTNVVGGKNVTITESGAASAVTVDGTAGSLVVTQNTAGNVTIGANDASSGTITVTDTAQGAGVINVDGGSTVSVTSSSTLANGATGGAINVGLNTVATGVVTVTENLKTAVGASVNGGTINVTGGTSIAVTETTTQAVRATTGANGTITESTVNVNGSTATTNVTVTQAATVGAVATIVAIAGTTETVSEKFVALGVGKTLTVAGLTFTAGATALTAAQTAAVFANLSNGATQGNSTLGTYSGTFTGWNTSAATTDTVVFTSSTANAVIAAPVFSTGNGATLPTGTVTVVGATATAAQAGVAGVTAGQVTIVDAKYAAAGTSTITKATLDGYGNGSVVASDALTTLSLANGGTSLLLVDNRKAASLALTVNNLGTKLGGAATVVLDAAGATYTSLNLTTTGADSAAAIIAAAVTGLTVTGTKAIDLTGSTFTALKTATISGSAGVTLVAGANVTDINAAATSGAVTVTALDSTKATYEGGSGVDKVTVASATITKAISLGAGNDTLTISSAAGAAPTVAVDGGTGTDTLVLVAADAVIQSGSASFATKVTGFEVLGLTGATGAQTVHLDVLGNYNSVTTGGGAGTLTLDGYTTGGTLTLTSAGAAYVASSTAFTTPTTDVFNIGLTNAASTAFGSVTVNKVETINLSSTDSNALHLVAGTNTNTLTLAADSATSLKITGNANLILNGANTTLTSVDASGMTGGLQYTAAGTVAETVKGGAAANFLVASTVNTTADTLIGGAAADTLVANNKMDTLTGGAGNDLFVIQTASVNANSYATITDASAGDKIQLSAVGTITFGQSKLALGGTAVFQDYANAAITGTAVGTISWFQYGGDTYIVEHESNVASTSFVNGSDLIVKLTGTVDLSHASLNTGIATLLIG